MAKQIAFNSIGFQMCHCSTVFRWSIGDPFELRNPISNDHCARDHGLDLHINREKILDNEMGLLVILVLEYSWSN